MTATLPSEEPPLYPLALRLKGLSCLVAGGGPAAARKAASLVECGAQVTVDAPEICPDMEKLPVTLSSALVQFASAGQAR